MSFVGWLGLTSGAILLASPVVGLLVMLSVQVFSVVLLLSVLVTGLVGWAAINAGARYLDGDPVIRQMIVSNYLLGLVVRLLGPILLVAVLAMWATRSNDVGDADMGSSLAVFIALCAGMLVIALLVEYLISRIFFAESVKLYFAQCAEYHRVRAVQAKRDPNEPPASLYSERPALTVRITKLNVVASVLLLVISLLAVVIGAALLATDTGSRAATTVWVSMVASGGPLFLINAVWAWLWIGFSRGARGRTMVVRIIAIVSLQLWFYVVVFGVPMVEFFEITEDGQLRSLVVLGCLVVQLVILAWIVAMYVAMFGRAVTLHEILRDASDDKE